MNKTSIWLIIPVITIVLFMSFNNIESIVTDSYSFLGQGDYIRPPLYPLLVKIFGQQIIFFQGGLWLITVYIIFRKTDIFGMVLYCSTIGLLFLSQKVLTETVFVFMITLAIISNKNWSFILICLTLFIKPVMIFFIPLLLITKMDKKFIIPGLIMVAVCIYYVWFSSEYICGHHWHGIGNYFVNIGRNCIGKTVGIEDLFWQRITQLQTLGFVLIGLSLLVFTRKNLLVLLPLYLILMSGLSPNQGDRYIIIIVPICILLFNEFYFIDYKTNNNELE